MYTELKHLCTEHDFNLSKHGMLGKVLLDSQIIKCYANLHFFPGLQGHGVGCLIITLTVNIIALPMAYKMPMYTVYCIL